MGGAVGHFGFPYEPEEADMAVALEKLPPCDVLLLHQPPRQSLLARCAGGYSGGSYSIQRWIEEGEHRHRAIVCGHIHEACGTDTILTRGGREILVMNAGSFGRPYPACRYGVLELPNEADAPATAEIVEVPR